MFDKITVYGQEGVAGGPDLGLLAEMLLFYGHVSLAVNAPQLKTLLRVCGYEAVRDLMDMGALSLVYLENHAGVRTTDGGTFNERHDFLVFGTPSQYLHNYLPQTLGDIIGKEGKGRRIAARLRLHISPLRHLETINGESLEDVATGLHVRSSVARVIRYLVPEYRVPNPLLFDVVRDGACVRVSTNIDFAALNLLYHRRVDPQHSTITPAYILAVLHQATAELKIAASANSEMALSPLSASIADARINSALRSRLRSDEVLRGFQEFVFDDARAVREAINSRHRNMAELVSLVLSAKKFKCWIKDQPEDQDIRKAYLAEISKLGWCDALPRKSARWAMFSTAGGLLSSVTTPEVGIIAGFALNAIDYFLVDRLAQGWKPHQFVEGPLREFLSARQD